MQRAALRLVGVDELVDAFMAYPSKPFHPESTADLLWARALFEKEDDLRFERLSKSDMFSRFPPPFRCLPVSLAVAALAFVPLELPADGGPVDAGDSSNPSPSPYPESTVTGRSCSRLWRAFAFQHR